MECTDAKKHVAIIEQCMMGETGLRHLFSTTVSKQYHFHFFRDPQAFIEAMRKTEFLSLIFSLSGLRGPRRECLMCLHQLAMTNPDMQRIVLANDASEALLVSSLYPADLHGILCKTESLSALLTQLMLLLGETHRLNDNIINHWFVARNRVLSPTEYAILHHMTRGLSMLDIATELNRNIKTIRAHKFNAMAKLGINSEVALLHAADILMCEPLYTVTLATDSAVA